MSVAPCPKRLETTRTSSGWETKSAISKFNRICQLRNRRCQGLFLTARLKHPPHTKLVVALRKDRETAPYKGSVTSAPSESLSKNNFNSCFVPPPEIKTNRVAANRRPVWHQPLRR